MSDERPDATACASQLRGAIARLGIESVIQQPAVRRNMLADLFASDPRTLSVLSSVADLGAVRTLHAEDAAPPEILIPRLSRQLSENGSLRPEAAAWAVRVWAAALRIDSKPTPGSDAAPSSAEIALGTDAPAPERTRTGAPGGESPGSGTITRRPQSTPSDQTDRVIASRPSRFRARWAVLGILLIGVIAAGAALVGSGVLTPAPARHRLSIEEQIPPTGVERFTAGGPLCPSGTFTDSVVRTSWLDSAHTSEDVRLTTRYRCDDGSGSIAATKHIIYDVDAADSTSSSTGRITLSGGTGAYAAITGSGTDTGQGDPAGNRTGTIAGTFQLTR